MKYVVIFLVSFCAVFTGFSQTGKVFDNLTIKSAILKMDRNYAVYLPPDYETSQREYPVLYLLHGLGDNHTGWIQFGEVQRLADAAIKDGSATPMVIVMPDANTKRIGYFNAVNGDWNYENFFFEEFIPQIEKTYRIKSEKRFRAISGLSMGGGGSFMYALHRPDLFSSACPLSAYIGPSSVDEAKESLTKLFNEPTLDESKLQTYCEHHNVLSLIENTSAEKLKSVKWFIDCGDDDFLYEGNSLVHIALRKKEIPHEFRIRNGAHTWTYWREALPVVLEFISNTFHQH
ncbi:alpha/beta hydrolase [Lutibacter sp.]|uniref:alpha/beta hydrolase n=1 Tax=Lutibacter sp. TaxID=1925666 RepID=UPI00356A63DD